MEGREERKDGRKERKEDDITFLSSKLDDNNNNWKTHAGCCPYASYGARCPSVLYIQDCNFWSMILKFKKFVLNSINSKTRCDPNLLCGKNHPEGTVNL